MSALPLLLTPQERALLATIAYTDQFSYPLTQEEVCQRLLKSKYADGAHDSLGQNLKGLMKKQYIETTKHEGQQYFFLPDQKHTVSQRINSARIAHAKIIEASQAAQLLSHLPWVEAVYLTGSLAMECADAQTDIDFLVITKPRRLWTLRLLVGILAQWKGKRRSWNNEKPGSWCFNLWLDSSNLEVAREKQDTYRAYEVMQAKLLWTKNTNTDPLREKNSWIKRFFSTSQLAKSVKNPLRNDRLVIISQIIDKIEDLTWTIQTMYMHKHRTTEQVHKGYAFFHPRDTAASIYANWQHSLSRILPKPTVIEILRPYVSANALS